MVRPTFSNNLHVLFACKKNGSCKYCIQSTVLCTGINCLHCFECDVDHCELVYDYCGIAVPFVVIGEKFVENNCESFENCSAEEYVEDSFELDYTSCYISCKSCCLNYHRFQVIDSCPDILGVSYLTFAFERSLLYRTINRLNVHRKIKLTSCCWGQAVFDQVGSVSVTNDSRRQVLSWWLIKDHVLKYFISFFSSLINNSAFILEVLVKSVIILKIDPF